MLIFYPTARTASWLSESDVLKDLKNDIPPTERKWEAAPSISMTLSLRSIEKKFNSLRWRQALTDFINQILGRISLQDQFWASSETAMPILLICEAVESWRDEGINYFSSKRSTRVDMWAVRQGWGGRNPGTTSYFLTLLVAVSISATFWGKSSISLLLLQSLLYFKTNILLLQNLPIRHHAPTRVFYFIKEPWVYQFI